MGPIEGAAKAMRQDYYDREEPVMRTQWEDLPQYRKDRWIALAQVAFDHFQQEAKNG